MSPRVFGLMVVRNAVDLIEVNLRHHFEAGLERMLVLDNGSRDGTRERLDELALQLPVDVEDDLGPYRQADLTNRLAYEARLQGAEWALPIDADEFFVAEPGLPAAVTGSSAGALSIEVLNFVQRHARHRPSARGLLTMDHRAQRTLPQAEAQYHVGVGEWSIVEVAWHRKLIVRLSEADLDRNRSPHAPQSGRPDRPDRRDRLPACPAAGSLGDRRASADRAPDRRGRRRQRHCLAKPRPRRRRRRGRSAVARELQPRRPPGGRRPAPRPGPRPAPARRRRTPPAPPRSARWPPHPHRERRSNRHGRSAGAAAGTDPGRVRRADGDQPGGDPRGDRVRRRRHVRPRRRQPRRPPDLGRSAPAAHRGRRPRDLIRRDRRLERRGCGDHGQRRTLPSVPRVHGARHRDRRAAVRAGRGPPILGRPRRGCGPRGDRAHRSDRLRTRARLAHSHRIALRRSPGARHRVLSRLRALRLLRWRRDPERLPHRRRGERPRRRAPRQRRHQRHRRVTRRVAAHDRERRAGAHRPRPCDDRRRDARQAGRVRALQLPQAPGDRRLVARLLPGRPDRVAAPAGPTSPRPAGAGAFTRAPRRLRRDRHPRPATACRPGGRVGTCRPRRCGGGGRRELGSRCSRSTRGGDRRPRRAAAAGAKPRPRRVARGRNRARRRGADPAPGRGGGARPRRARRPAARARRAPRGGRGDRDRARAGRRGRAQRWRPRA